MNSLTYVISQLEKSNLNNGKILCRCCNDRMPIAYKKTIVTKTGVKIKQIVKAKRKPTLRRANANQEKVSNVVEFLVDLIKKDTDLSENIHNTITKESVAKIMNVPEHQVRIAFHKLNLIGKLSQGVNVPPHDSKRDFWGGHDSSWSATQYTIL